jgi:hypothetical protein
MKIINVRTKFKSCENLRTIFDIYFFEMSTQEGGGGFELVTSALLDVVPTD